MWKAEQILANARYEKKKDYSIYAYYLDYLKNSDVAYDSKTFEKAKKELKEILEVKNERNVQQKNN